MVEIPVEFLLLGDVAARIDGRLVDVGHLRQRCVLAVLLVEAGRAVPVEQLIDRAWGDQPPQRARGTLRSYLSRLRKSFAAQGFADDDVAIARQPGGYRLSVDPMAVDAHRFRRLVEDARAAGDAALFEEALGLWRGDALAMLDTPWLNGVRETLDGQRIAAELDRNDLALGCGRHGELLDDLLRSAGLRPLDERAAGQLLLALYRCGRQAEALDRYERIRQRLARELGADPSPPLRRLHRQILTADPALDPPARAVAATGSRSGQPPLPRQLPAPPAAFTGRLDELAELGKLFSARPDRGTTVVISAIGGAGGVGKTWLALRWAHDNLERFPDGQLYANLRGFQPGSEPMAPGVAVRAFLDALGVRPAALPVDADAQTALYRSLVAERRMLIVLDNARDTAQVTPLLPGTATCTLLVTSRNQLAGLITAHGARPLTLDMLSDGEARQLLTNHLGADRVAAEPDQVDALVRHCAGLPLALGIVAARAALRPGRPFAALAGELREAATRLDGLDAGELAASVRAVLSCSYEALPAGAAHMFRLLGLAPGPDISLPAAASLAGLPLPRVRVLLQRLAGGHLVQEHAPGRYRMHDLVQLYAAEQARRLGTGDERRAATQRVLDHYLYTAHTAAQLLNPQRLAIRLDAPRAGTAPENLGDDQRALAWFVAEHAVLLAALEQAAGAGFDTHVWRLAWTLANYLERQGHWHVQIATQRAAVEATRRLGDRAGQAGAHRGLANACALVGRFAEADAHLRQALELFGTLGDGPGQAYTRIGLGWLAARQGHTGEALHNAEQALELFRLAGDEGGQANALNNIGWYHAQLGDHGQTLELSRRALTLYRGMGNRFGEAEAWDSIGYAHHHLGENGQAAECYRHALAIFQELEGRYGEAEVLSHLGDAHEATGELDAARQAWRQALALLERLGHTNADQVRAKLERLATP